MAERLPPPKLLDEDDNTVLINDNYTGNQSYPYHVQYTDKLKPLYEPTKLGNHFLPKFKLPYDSVPSIIC